MIENVAEPLSFIHYFQLKVFLYLISAEKALFSNIQNYSDYNHIYTHTNIY